MKKMLTVLLVAVLGIPMVGCASSEQVIVSLITSAAVAAEQLYAAESGQAENLSWEQQITADGQLYITFYNAWKSDPSTDKWAKVVGVAKTLNSDIVPTLQAFHVNNPASQQKITAAVEFVVAQLEAWMPVIQGTSGANMAQLSATFIEVSAKQAAGKKPLAPTDFAKGFNAILAVKTGNPKGDAKSKKLKIHPPKFGRVGQ